MVGEGMLQGIYDKFGDDQPEADGRIGLNVGFVGLDFDREDAWIGDHGSAEAPAELREVGAYFHDPKPG